MSIHLLYNHDCSNVILRRELTSPPGGSAAHTLVLPLSIVCWCLAVQINLLIPSITWLLESSSFSLGFLLRKITKKGKAECERSQGKHFLLISCSVLRSSPVWRSSTQASCARTIRNREIWREKLEYGNCPAANYQKGFTSSPTVTSVRQVLLYLRRHKTYLSCSSPW